MKKLTLIVLVLNLLSPSLLGQTIDIAETTFKIAGLGGDEVFYYGFSEGDQLIFNFEEVNGKELKEVEIIEYPSTIKFSDFKSKKIENKVLNISRSGIYKFRFSNSAMSGRVCKIKIQRIPGSEATKDFNTTVLWRTVQDTTYTPTEEKYLVRSDTVAQEVYSACPQISSQNALNGNSNSQVVDFVLPNNTVAWSFYIGTGKEGKEEYDRARSQFMKSAASTVSAIPGYGPMAALALTGVSFFSKVQGEDNVKYWFISDANSVALFNAGQTFMQYKKGDVVNEASQMQNPLRGKIFLGLVNDNLMDPILVTIKVTAITVTQEWATRTIQVMNVKNRKEPYLEG